MPEKFPSHILCPVDFSELSRSALQYAARLSSACAADVTAVHAHWFETPPYFTPAITDELKGQYQSAAAEARTALQNFVESAGVTAARLMIEEGDAATSIMRSATQIGADLIVMGTHGRRGLERFMLGSVAERVVRTSPIPVLTVRGPAPSEKIARILCPVNNSAASRESFRKAARLASSLGAQLTAVHIEEDDPKSRIDDLCAWLEGEVPDCSVQDLRGRGNAAEEILKLARDSGTGLLVIGATHQTFFDSTVLGTTTVRVVRHAACPVLTVPYASGDGAA